MRISFDMDGVLADLDSALGRLATAEFGSDRPSGRGGAHGPSATRGSSPSAMLERLSARNQARLWQRVAGVRNFWEAVGEHEPGTIRRLQDLAYHLRWEVLFVTQRPPTAGRTVQVQTQRWLHKHGYDLPAVFTTRGSRGRMAEALSLDVHVDDRLENAVDIASDSKACPVLVWRDEATLPDIQATTRKLSIAVVRSVGEAIETLAAADKALSAAGGSAGAGDDASHSGPAVVARLRRAFGL